MHGRGSVDMKGGVIAALHALAALRAAGTPTPEVVLQCVPSEEDGGLGTFAALERDDRFDACLIPEPTGFAVVCAQAGALTFRGTVRGRAAHAAMRLEGRSAIDRYVAVHAALAEHEARINAAVEHPAMRALELPYPVSVGRVAAGDWSSSVPDRLVFEGRVGVRVGEDPAAARAAFEAAVRERGRRGPARRDRVDRRRLRLGRDGSRAPVGGARAGGGARRARRRRAGRRPVGRRHAALLRARHPDVHGRDERDRARARGRRARARGRGGRAGADHRAARGRFAASEAGSRVYVNCAIEGEGRGADGMRGSVDRSRRSRRGSRRPHRDAGESSHGGLRAFCPVYGA